MSCHGQDHNPTPPIVDPTHTGVILRQEEGDEEGEVTTESSLNDWRPCRLTRNDQDDPPLKVMIEPPKQSDIRQYLSRDDGGAHDRLVEIDYVELTCPPTHSSQDDDKQVVKTGVRYYGSSETRDDQSVKNTNRLEKTVDKSGLYVDNIVKDDTLVEIDCVEPTCLPTHSSQDDDKFEVKTGVRNGGSGETRDGQFVMDETMHATIDDECEFMSRKTWCKKHNCQVNKIIVTSKKWQWIQSKKCYGNVSSKVSKYLCKDKKTGRVVHNISPTRPNLANRTQGAINTVGRGSSCDVKQVAASINERESRQTDGDVKS